MKLQAAAVESFLKAPDKKYRAALIYGPDEGQVRERAQILARRIVEDPADPFRIAQLTPEQVNSDPAALLDEVNALSLMGGRRLVLLRGASDKAGPACTALAADESQSDSFVIVEAGDLSPRSSLRKLFEGNARLAAIACYVDDEKSLARLIRENAARAKKSLPTTTRLLIYPRPCLATARWQGALLKSLLSTSMRTGKTSACFVPRRRHRRRG